MLYVSHTAVTPNALQALQAQLADALADNDALRSELAAFDPEFWKELEDLKWDRQQLAEKVAAYEHRYDVLGGRSGQR
jgi:hypothetical protein